MNAFQEWLEKNPKIEEFVTQRITDVQKLGKGTARAAKRAQRKLARGSVGSRVAVVAGGFGEGVGQGVEDIWRGTKKSFTEGKINRFADFASRHPKALLGGVGALGLMAANPFGGAYEQIVNQGMLGQPHATRAVISAGALIGFQNALASPQQKAMIQGGYTDWNRTDAKGYAAYQYPGGGTYNPTFPVQGPMSFVDRSLTPASGDIVLGMWNLRHSGSG